MGNFPDGHLLALAGLGLSVVRCWGGGKALPGTNFKDLADTPPRWIDSLDVDYSGGMAIICGTAHPAGGFVVGVDIDEGPLSWDELPPGFLYMERGTAPGKWHIFIRTTNQLNGQINLRDSNGKLAVEIKGRGAVLRSWPTLPLGKPAGYLPVAISRSAVGGDSVVTWMQVTAWMADHLDLTVEKQSLSRANGAKKRRGRVVSAGASSRIFDEIVNELERRGGRCVASTGGGVMAHCPMHDDHIRSLSVHPIRGWKCFATCGGGRLAALASKLGLTISNEE